MRLHMMYNTFLPVDGIAANYVFRDSWQENYERR